jgi:Protein of unknown function (DUF3551)
VRALALGLAAIAAATLAVAAASAATSHPWCLIIQDRDDGWACGFDTFEQCRVEARSGNTGFCAQNPAYQPPVQPARPKKRDRR